jgi:hypothetical protein
MCPTLAGVLRGFWESDLKARSAALKTPDEFADNNNAPPVDQGRYSHFGAKRWVMSASKRLYDYPSASHSHREAILAERPDRTKYV